MTQVGKAPGVRELDVAVAAARAGADELRRAAEGDLTVEYKGERANPVTEADLRSQDAITRVLLGAFPGHAVDGEEGRAGDPRATHVWYVDPLDGTTNFTHGMPFFCVSIALRVPAEPTGTTGAGGTAGAAETVVGVVYDPVHDAMFTAEKGKGAFRNGQLCSVSGTASAGRALVVAQERTSDPGRIRGHAELTARLMRACGGVRSLGSPALTLCAIACGRLDAYCERAMDAWPILAGQLILREAGGTLTTFTGEPYGAAQADVAASNGLIHGPLLAALRD